MRTNKNSSSLFTKTAQIGLSIEAFFCPIGHLVLPPTILIVIFIKYLGCLLLLISLLGGGIYIRNSEIKRSFFWLLLFYVSTIPGWINANISPGLFLNIFMPFIFMVAIANCPIVENKRYVKFYVIGVFLSIVYVICYSLGFLPRPPDDIAYDLSLSSLDHARVIGLSNSVESASVHRGVAILLMLFFLKDTSSNISEKFLVKLAWLILIFYHLWAYFYTGHGRAGLLFMIVGLGVYVVNLKLTKFKIVVFFLSILLLIQLLGIKTDIFSAKRDIVINKSSYSDEQLDEKLDEFTSGRWNKTLVAIKMIKTNPVMGIGLNQFVYKFNQYNFSSSGIHLANSINIIGSISHISSKSSNVYIDYAAESGILSGILLFIFMIKSLFYAYQIQRYTKYSCFGKDAIILFSVLAGSIIVNTVEGDMPLNFYQHIWWSYIFGFLLAIDRSYYQACLLSYDDKKNQKHNAHN